MLCSVGVVSRRRVDNIESKSESLIKHLRYNSSEKWTVELQARVGIDLDKPRVEVAINHKIKTKDLKIMFFPLRRYFNKNTFNRIQSNLFHLTQNIFLKIILIFIVSIQIFLKLCIGYLICLLISTIKWCILLNCIVCQVDLSIEVVDIELI